jgi:hypothetical protein
MQVQATATEARRFRTKAELGALLPLTPGEFGWND